LSGLAPTRKLRSDRNEAREILEKLAAGEISTQDASRLMEEANREKRGSLYCKVSPKGAISVYGLQRMPVTLYVEQWNGC